MGFPILRSWQRLRFQLNSSGALLPNGGGIQVSAYARVHFNHRTGYHQLCRTHSTYGAGSLALLQVQSESPRY